MFLFFVKPLTNHNFHRRKDFGRESAKTHKKPRGYRVGCGRREVGRSRMKEEHVTCMLDQTAGVGCLHAEERARWAIGAYLRENQGFLRLKCLWNRNRRRSLPHCVCVARYEGESRQNHAAGQCEAKWTRMKKKDLLLALRATCFSLLLCHLVEIELLVRGESELLRKKLLSGYFFP